MRFGHLKFPVLLANGTALLIASEQLGFADGLT
jgi:hypothetical protein